MQITCYGANSKGNCYHVRIGELSVLLDAGVARKTLLRRGLSMSGVDVALITHIHADHSLMADELLRAGVIVFTNEDTAEILKPHNQPPNLRVIKDLETKQVKGIRICAYPLMHDVPCQGFYLRDIENNEGLLYVTDTGNMDAVFKGMTHLMIEANHDEDMLRKAYHEGRIDKSQYNHISCGHLSIQRAVEYVKRCKLEDLQAIYLIHLSDRHAQCDHFKAIMQRETGIPTYIARAGETYG